MTTPGSPSIARPDYWWYRARADLLRAALEGFVRSPSMVLDVGSADGPSVGWLRGHGHRVALDIDVRGLERGDVCGSATRLPFADATFDLVAAFDVVEHCDPESAALDEITRVLRPGGQLLMSVPAYMWAWTSHDVRNRHYRRYTRGRATRAVEAAGLEVQRATYAFAGTFPFFAADRIRTRLRERRTGGTDAGSGEVPPLPEVAPAIEKLLLCAAGLDRRVLGSRNLPFGSSVLVAARKSRVETEEHT